MVVIVITITILVTIITIITIIIITTTSITIIIIIIIITPSQVAQTYMYITHTLYIVCCLAHYNILRYNVIYTGPTPRSKLASSQHQRHINGVVSNNKKSNNFGFAGIKRPF